MSLLHALLLGVIQGLTEFLPVSSTAHLTVVEHLFKVPPAWRLSFDILLHLGTTMALIAFFLPRLERIVAGLFSRERTARQANWRLVLIIALGSVPAAVAGFLLKDRLEVMFELPLWSAAFLVITGGALFLTRGAAGQRTQPTWQDALFIGCAQAVALLPGISRSGSTIAVALLLGLARAEAFEFSMLLSIPAVLGAAILKVKDAPALRSGTNPLVLAAGLVASLVVGMAALYLLRRVMKGQRLWLFAIYCWLAAIVIASLSWN
jgi:undecaprenyl-diphosphatase